MRVDLSLWPTVELHFAASTAKRTSAPSPTSTGTWTFTKVTEQRALFCSCARLCLILFASRISQKVFTRFLERVRKITIIGFLRFSPENGASDLRGHRMSETSEFYPEFYCVLCYPLAAAQGYCESAAARRMPAAVSCARLFKRHSQVPPCSMTNSVSK